MGVRQRAVLREQRSPAECGDQHEQENRRATPTHPACLDDLFRPHPELLGHACLDRFAAHCFKGHAMRRFRGNALKERELDPGRGSVAEW
jgi:hypothetical protein